MNETSIYNTDDIIYALATGWVKSAIAVIRVSGAGCIQIVSKTFACKKKLTDYLTNTAVFGNLYTDEQHTNCIDQCIITVFKNGHGYTGEESLEISCHGGLETVRQILKYLENLGFRQAKRGEFTLRAFLHSKMDLTQAEAVNELINTGGERGRIGALNRLKGSLYTKVAKIKDLVLQIMSVVEVQLDYAEDEIGEDLSFPTEKLQTAINMLQTLVSTYQTGKLYAEGVKIVLAGATNAGKSSLFNLFLKEERAIVSQTRGTTRDYIEAQCAISGIPVKLYDTAGLRESTDTIEEEGIKRSYSLLNTADIIIYLVDASEPVIDKNIVSDSRCIAVVNKIDLQSDLHTVNYDDFIKISVKTAEGFDNLCTEIEKKLTVGLPDNSDNLLIIENQRQQNNLNCAKNALETVLKYVQNNVPLDIVTMQIQEALQNLGELTGEVTTDDILDKIFSSFCVGK